MKLLRNSAIFAAVTSLVIVTGCSSSEFGSAKGDGPSAGAQKGAKEENKTNEEQTDDTSSDDKDAKDEQDSKLDSKEGASASDYEADESTKGCQLPNDVKAKFGAQGGKIGFALEGWGGSGSTEMELTNLSLTDCSWFQKFKDSDAIYIVQYDEKSAGADLIDGVVQSYAEPFNGKTGAEFAQCLRAAAAAGATCHRVGDL